MACNNRTNLQPCSVNRRRNELIASLTLSRLGLIVCVIICESARSSSPGSNLCIRYSFTETPFSRLRDSPFMFSSPSMLLSPFLEVETVRFENLELFSVKLSCLETSDVVAA
ncbi:hypothetical protein LXL04_017845 [Taraxacum kok-saghyz]